MNITAQPEKVYATLYDLDPPVPYETEVPAGWILSRDGLYLPKFNGTKLVNAKEITSSPVLITRRLKASGTGDEWTELAWFRDGRWQHKLVERKTIANRNKIIELAGSGFPVTSSNASKIVDFIAQFEATNLGVLPVETVSTHLGWQDRGQNGFLLGMKHITENSSKRVSFHPSDKGDGQIAEAFYKSGTLEGWCEGIRPIQDFPRVLMAFFASLTAPLLEVLGAPNFIVDFSSPTSQGKTIALRVAASIWGNPDERKEASLVHGWDSTKVWAERASAVLQSLPLLLDDTKRCKKDTEVASLIYMVANGQGRGRGTPDGLQNTGSWRTVLLSTGERAATSFTQDGGTHARCLTIWGAPWKRTDHETGILVNKIHDAVRENYGWAGEEFVTFLVGLRPSCAGDWLVDYQKIKQEYQSRAAGTNVVMRITDYFAAILMAAKLAHEYLSLPWAYEKSKKALDTLWEDLKSEASNADKAKEALEYVYSWAQSHQGDFFGRENGRTPFAGYAGRWDEGDEWQYLGLFPHHLKKVLDDAEFEYNAVLRTWKDRGWIETDNEKEKKRFTKKIRVNGTPSGLIVFRRAALEEPEDHAADPESSTENGKDQDAYVSFNPETFMDSDELTGDGGTWEHSGNASGNIH